MHEIKTNLHSLIECFTQSANFLFFIIAQVLTFCWQVKYQNHHKSQGNVSISD